MNYVVQYVTLYEFTVELKCPLVNKRMTYVF